MRPKSVYTGCDVTAQLTLKMGYKEIKRVVYTRRDVGRRHNDMAPEMAQVCTHFIMPARDIAPNPMSKPLEGRWYQQGNFLQQLLYYGDIAPSVNSWAIFDALTPCCGVNYHCCVAPSVNVASIYVYCILGHKLGPGGVFPN